MGFAQVYDFVAGKKAWGSYGLPHEGTKVPAPLAAEVARRDVPTCTLNDELADVRERVRADVWDTCIVVSKERVVLGRLGRKAIAGDSDETVASAMAEGPSTVRPSMGADALLGRIRERNLTSLLVTTPDGKLLGLALRRDLE